MIIKSEITCGKCNREIRGTITLDSENKVVDSDGFMVFADEAVCDTCLDDLPAT